MKNEYSKGFEQIEDIPEGKIGDGWIRVFFLEYMIATPGVGYTRKEAHDIIMAELKKRGDDRKDLDIKTVGKILAEIRVGLLNSKNYSVRCSRDKRASKTKSFQYILRIVN